MILEMTRGHIKLKVGEKTVTIYGEALLPAPGEPDFVCSRDSVKTWDPPYDKQPLTDDERQQIFDMVRGELSQNNMLLEID